MKKTSDCIVKNISVKLPFESTQDQTNEALKKLAREVYRNYLGRIPTEEDATNFRQSANADNSSINDLFFQGKKIGSLGVTYLLDIPRAIKLDFTTHH